MAENSALPDTTSPRSRWRPEPSSQTQAADARIVICADDLVALLEGESGVHCGLEGDRKALMLRGHPHVLGSPARSDGRHGETLAEKS